MSSPSCASRSLLASSSAALNHRATRQTRSLPAGPPPAPARGASCVRRPFTRAAPSLLTLHTADPPTSSPAPEPLASTSGAAPVSLVVGAGPAGILSAVQLARRGHEVHVYDRRPSPLEADASDPHRAFFIILQERGARALRDAGLHLRPGAGLQRTDALGFGTARRLAFASPKLMGPRHAFVRAMVEQAIDLGLPNLHWHWGAAFSGVDLATKTAAFEAAGDDSSSSGSSSEGAANAAWQQPYDLLVAADGAWSRVRRAAAAQAPELTFSVQPNQAQYKVARGLPAAAAPGFAPQPAPADGGGADPAAVQLRVLRASGAHGLSEVTLMLLGPSPAGDGTVDVLVYMGGEASRAGLDTPEAAASFLADQFPAVPAAWLPLLAEQLAAAPASVAGMSVKASQLHTPGGVVLVGDAAHGVTPRTGNGMNCGLEDASLLGQLLETHGVDALPAAFTAARLEDAHALLYLDDTQDARMGRGPWGRLNPAALAFVVASLVRGLLSRVLPGRVAPPTQQAMNSGQLTYAAVKAQVQRDCLLLATVGLPLVAAAGLAIAAAEGVHRLRVATRAA